MILNAWNDFWANVGKFFQNYGESLYKFWFTTESGTPYIANFIFALLFLVLGYFLIKLINKGIRRILKIGKKKFKNDKTIKNFVANLINITLNVFLVIGFLSILGISLNGITTVFSSAILAIGLSLQDVIGNFASGLIILTSKPFITGDYVSINNEDEGTIIDVRFLATYLKTFDDQIIIIPNKTITSGVLKNYSTSSMRRVVVETYVDRDSDVNLVKNGILNLTNEDNRIMIDQGIGCSLSEIRENSYKFSLKFFVKSDIYWDVLYEYNEKVANFMQNEGIKRPISKISYLKEELK